MKILIRQPEIMTFKDFISKVDREGSIVLLEGKREVSEMDIPNLISLGRLLAEHTKFIKFRSGNAEGADKYFSEGVAQVDMKRLQVITPYSGHRQKNNVAYETISLDNINLAMEPEIIYYSKKNPKAKNLVDQYILGENKQLSNKGAYLLRDTVKVTGTRNGLPPTSFAIFYDDLRQPMTGGTGHTMQMCKENMVAYVDQRTWFKWLV